MTDNEINCAIAEALGWAEIEQIKEVFVGLRPNGPTHKLFIPDYCNDLNAMHEAENNALDGYGKKDIYIGWLRNICGNSAWSISNATARQRAEALLRTICKWKDV